MSGAWLEVREGGRVRRLALGPDGIEVGPPGSDLPLAGARGRLRITLDPPRVRHEGSDAPPERAARSWPEGALAEGDVLEWSGARLSVHGLGSLRSAGGGSRAGPAEAAERLGRRVAAGVAVEIGLAPREAARRIQAEAVRGAFDPDAAASELLEGVELEDPRLFARVATLERDLVLVPLQRGGRGALRKARQGVRTGLAGLLAQALVLCTLCALILAVLVLARARWDLSVDLWLDRVLGRG